ncbi:extracellular solute-binding protein [Halarcobacter sp.]|uniref:extracellular solute-binding protein n=1 Tax=Halarcobacter sp. TaxID=2321133 RepID=UPI002AA761A3|nr:extracellular solute-binding protein [Halarcobacter sp.]
MKYLVIVVLFFYTNMLFAQKQAYITIGNEPKYKEGFKHFEYTNPNAKKGGVFKAATIGTFDSFNPFILKGRSAAGIGMVYDTLMTSSLDEPFVYYPLIAQYVEISKDNDWVKFYINKKARFQDGKEVTAQDIKFSFDTLINKGSPQYKRYYFDVKEAVVLDKYTIQFNFKTNKNKELPLILGQLKVLPKHFWKNKDFLDSDSVIPLGSGPYIVDKFKYGKYVSYKLDKNYWAKNLNVNVGQYNYGKIQYDYYKDRTVTLEAFISGEFDYRMENSAKNWATLYTGENFDKGKIVKKEIKHEKAQGMQAFVFNIRKPLFQDIEVRKALNLAFDFEWTNKKLFYNQYKRLNSYFANCELSAVGKPSKEELKLLDPFKNELPKEVFGEAFKSNITDGSGNIRKQLRKALKILKSAGWKFENKVLVKDGKKFEFEILLGSSSMEKVLNPYIKNLEKIGVIAKVRVIDQVAYANKIKSFDYDMTIRNFRVSLSPGNEQRNYWGSQAANIKGSKNYIGIKSKAVDSLIDTIIKAQTRKELITAVRALDRVLTHNYYVIPNWYISSYRLSYWNKFNQPKIAPKYGLGVFTWWIKEEFRK